MRLATVEVSRYRTEIGVSRDKTSFATILGTSEQDIRGTLPEVAFLLVIVFALG